MLMPLSPERVPPLEPLMLTPLIRTIRKGSVPPELVALIVMPLVPVARMEPKVPVQSIVMDFVMVMPPNPPGSRQSISPLVAVLEMAPAKVLQGAVRLQGLTSSPTPETQVRVAWALAGATDSNGNKN